MTEIKIPKLSSLIETRKLDWVNSDIKDGLFETPKEISSGYKLYHFNKYISSEDAIKEMEKEGYRPANAWELLLWKDWNDKDWVVALGSVGKVGGDRFVPYLGKGGSKRDLYLHCWFGDWNARFRFLGVRNSALKTSDTEKTALGHSDTLSLAIKTVRKAGHIVILKKNWYITGQGNVMEMGDSNKSKGRKAFWSA